MVEIDVWEIERRRLQEDLLNRGVVAFDHLAHQYSPTELTERLLPYVGKYARGQRFNAYVKEGTGSRQGKHRIGGVILHEDGRFLIKSRSDDLTDLSDLLITGSDGYYKFDYTVLEITPERSLNSRIEQGFEYMSDVVVFDHRVHDYTLKEIEERLRPYIGRRLGILRSFEGGESDQLATLEYESGKYFLRGEFTGGVLDLSHQLTTARDSRLDKKQYHTILVFSNDEEFHEECTPEILKGSDPIVRDKIPKFDDTSSLN